MTQALIIPGLPREEIPPNSHRAGARGTTGMSAPKRSALLTGSAL